MDSITELKRKAKAFKEQDNYKEAFPILEEIYQNEKNEWNGYYLAQCYRKNKDFGEARVLLNEIIEKYPDFKLARNEELWLDYTEKIKNPDNYKIVFDAEIILSKTNKYDKYTGSIFNKTVLKTVEYLHKEEDYRLAFEWLNKIDFNTLSNKSFKNMASDQKMFFSLYGKVLAEANLINEYIESCLICIGFEGLKLAEFRKFIISEFTYEYNGDIKFNINRIAYQLKLFIEEIYNRKKNKFSIIFNNSNTIKISEIGAFVYCPVSFVINQTFSTSKSEFGQKPLIYVEKLSLFERHRSYQFCNDIEEVFEDTDIDLNDSCKSDFNEIFNSKMVSTHKNGDPTYFSNENDTIRGSPDYVFENINGERFVVLEKFSSYSKNDTFQLYDNDLAMLNGFLYSLTTLNVEYGYILYWYCEREKTFYDIDNDVLKYKIKRYKIFKINKSDVSKEKHMAIIQKLTTLKREKNISIVGMKVSHPNKCLNCSVFSYCNHKTGKFDIIDLPYNIQQLATKIFSFSFID